MRKELVQTGKTVEEAINSACLRLGYKREECEWDIIDLPKTSFFGLKKTPAKVKVWIILSEAQIKKEKAHEDYLKKSEEAKNPAPPKQAPKSAEVKPVPKKPNPKPATAPAPRPAVSAPKFMGDDSNEIRGENREDKEKLNESVKYIKEMLVNMGIEGEVQTLWENGGLTIAIYGKGLGVLIGRRGETLNAIQYLVGLVANRLEGEYLRVNLDSGDYRLKRNSSLVDMAKKAVEQVVRTNISKTLEIMNPAERRVVHSVVSEMEGVGSISVGKDPYRRVIIKTPTSKTRNGNDKRDFKGGGNGGRDRNDRGNSRDRGGYKPNKPRSFDRDRPRPERAEVVADQNVPEIDPGKVGETPLYGKIEL